jgi:hypothetical protein
MPRVGARPPRTSEDGALRDNSQPSRSFLFIFERRYWRCKSRNLGGRPPVSVELRALIRRMSLENTLWGAPHIHGELLKLGFTVAQSTVAKYMATKGDGPSGQSWGTFLRNHMPHIAAIDLFVVPTIGFRLLYALVIVRLARRELV